MEFTVKIELNTSSMSTLDDVGRVLKKLADEFRGARHVKEGPGNIVDATGNVVGQWAVKRSA
jgi:hypothetical protein